MPNDLTSQTYEPSPREWVREQVETYERTGGREGGTMLGRRVVILTSLGARSGKVRKTPVLRIEHDGVYAVVASQGGAPVHPRWYFNLRQNPDVMLQDGPEAIPFRAREVYGAERTLWWSRAVGVMPEYQEYAHATARVIPVLLLETNPT